MAKDHALWMQASRNTFLFVVKDQICNLYSGLEGIKASRKGGSSLSGHHFIAEATSPVRSVKKEQEKKPTTPAHSEQ
jgi:hypothetical protein